MILLVYAVAGFGFVTGDGRVSAQSAAASTDAISNGELVRMELPFRRVSATADDRAGWETRPHWTFGPFDETRYGFHSITLILDHYAKKNECAAEERALLRLIAEVKRPAGSDYWILDRQSPSDPCDVSAETEWTVMESGRPPAAKLAAPDPSMPIVRFVHSGLFSGNRVTTYTDHQLILDFRGAVPVLSARVSSVKVDGYCVSSELRPTASCAWDAARQDFVCTEEYVNGRRYVAMLSGQKVERSLDPSAIKDLSGFIERVSGGPPGQWAQLPDVGAVRLVAEIPSQRPGRRIFLLGASGTFGAPFMAAVKENGRTNVIRLRIHSVAAQYRSLSDLLPEPASLSLEGYRETGEPPMFKVRKLNDNDQGLWLLSVRAESPGDDSPRSLYHVVIDETAEGIFGEAVFVAEEIPNQWKDGLSACQLDNTVPSTAAAAVVRQSPLQIDYDIEPSFEMTESGPHREPDECTLSASARWRRGQGFEITQRNGSCPVKRIRSVSIRPDGALRARILPAR